MEIRSRRSPKPDRHPLVLLVVILGVAGCFVHTGAPLTAKTAKARPVVVGIAGGEQREMALLIRLEWRAASYHWDRVPADDTPIQVLRPCNYYTMVLGVAPVTARRWWCWDQKQRALLTFAGAATLEAVAAEHPDWIWIIGNEPNLSDQDDMSPEAYAEFFGHVAMALTRALRPRDPQAVPRLVFCQVSSPAQKEYCEHAYFILQRLIRSGRLTEWPRDVHVADVIHALSVHSYVRTDSVCDPDRWRCFGARLEEDRLEETMATWQHGLDEFARWAKSVDRGALAAKPLWLTEFGILSAFCPRPLDVRRGDPEGSVHCQDAAKRGNGRPDDDPVFYGRNDREGIWGVQRLGLGYLLNPENDPKANQGDWAAAWWFAGSLPWYVRGECFFTGWLFGHDVDCGRDVDRVSRAGETFRDTLECLTSGRRCPVASQPRRTRKLSGATAGLSRRSAPHGAP